MAQTFSYDNTLITPLDYARWRLDDYEDPADPYLWNETYNTMIARLGLRHAMIVIASQIATIIANRETSFGEAAGIRYTLGQADYYRSLPDILRTENIPGNVDVGPTEGTNASMKTARSGRLLAGRYPDPRRFPDVLREPPLPRRYGGCD